MPLRKYGSINDPKPTTDAEGHEIRPDGTTVLSDDEIRQRIRDKDALLAQLARERGTKSTPIPTARQRGPKPVDPAEKQQLEADLTVARADLHALAEAEREAKRQEAVIAAQADAERKDRRLALQQHADEIQARVEEVTARARTEKLKELARDHAGAADRNAQLAEAGRVGRREEMERFFRPILTEIEATLQEANAFLTEHGDALRSLTEQDFSTTDQSFPIRVRQRLSSECFRPAERLLADINTVLACGNAAGEGRWDTILRTSIQAGELVGSRYGLSQTIAYAKSVNRDHLADWRRRLAHITDRLEKLTAEGKAGAMAPPQIIVKIDDRARQEAKHAAQYGSMKSTRPTTAETGSIFE
jgi:hypothetical protein